MQGRTDLREKIDHPGRTDRLERTGRLGMIDYPETTDLRVMIAAEGMIETIDVMTGIGWIESGIMMTAVERAELEVAVVPRCVTVICTADRMADSAGTMVGQGWQKRRGNIRRQGVVGSRREPTSWRGTVAGSGYPPNSQHLY